jgi:acetyl esterase
VVVNIHGGGFVIGNPRQDQHLARGIAGEVGAVVVNVDYSIAPRARFPRALEECFDVLQWVARSGPEMGWDASRIAMSGGSAGANLALGTIALARRSGGPAVRTAALIVPAVDQTVDPNVRTSPLDKPFVSPALMTTSYASYFTDPAERSDPLASPVLLGDELTGFPPLLVVTAGLDTFLPYIDAFTARARAHGVDVTSLEIEGVDHDFYFSGKTATPVLLDLMVLVRDQLLGHLR